VGVYRTWTVSTSLLRADSARCMGANLPSSRRDRARPSPSLPSPSSRPSIRNPSSTHGTTICRVLVASSSPLSPFAAVPSPSGPPSLHRLTSIKPSFTAHLHHHSSIAKVFRTASGRFLFALGRVVSLFPTHPLAPAGDLRSSKKSC
jgi:hypothetical protein